MKGVIEMAGNRYLLKALAGVVACTLAVHPVMASDSVPSTQFINIEGTRYEVSSGKVTFEGIEYTVADGIVTINGTDYSIISEFSKDGQTTCVVRALVASSYCVACPSDFLLAKDTYSESSTYGKYVGSYTVGCKGNIMDTQKVTIIPDSAFAMQTADGSQTATAEVTQEIKNWKNTVSDASDILIASDEYVSAAGTVVVDLPKAGEYSGQLKFTFCLEEDT